MFGFYLRAVVSRPIMTTVQTGFMPSALDFVDAVVGSDAAEEAFGGGNGFDACRVESQLPANHLCVV